MKSIAQELIELQELEFFDEHNVKVNLYEETDYPKYSKLYSKFENPFKPPFLVIDSFMKDSKHPPKLKGIEMDELKKLGFALTVSLIDKRSKWFSNQRVFYRLESLSSLSMGSRRMSSLPSNHRIVRDIANERLRLEGKNAGPKGMGSWINLKKEGEIL